MQGLTWLDAIWGLIILALLLRGLIRGLMQEVMELVGLGLAAYAGLQLYPVAGDWLVEQVPGLPEQAARAAAFGVVAAGVMAAATVATGLLVHLVRLSPLSWVDSLSGAVLGGIKGLAVVAAFVVLFATLPPGNLRQALSDSRISREIRESLPQAWEALGRLVPEGVVLPPLPALEEPARPGPQPPAPILPAPERPPRRGGLVL